MPHTEKSTPDHGCRCSGDRPKADIPARAVRANIPQDIEAKINFRVVPSRELKPEQIDKKCRPRGHRSGWRPGEFVLDPAIITKLVDADKSMMAWMAKSPGNAETFMRTPVEALSKAGVELTRAEMKAVARAHASVAEAAAVGPGVSVSEMTFKAFPKGKIGKIKPNARKKDDGADDDSFGCEPKRRGK